MLRATSRRVVNSNNDGQGLAKGNPKERLLSPANGQLPQMGTIMTNCKTVTVGLRRITPFQPQVRTTQWVLRLTRAAAVPRSTTPQHFNRARAPQALIITTSKSWSGCDRPYPARSKEASSFRLCRSTPATDRLLVWSISDVKSMIGNEPKMSSWTRIFQFGTLTVSIMFTIWIPHRSKCMRQRPSMQFAQSLKAIMRLFWHTDRPVPEKHTLWRASSTAVVTRIEE